MTTATQPGKEQILAIARARRYAQTGEGQKIRLEANLALQHIADGVGRGVATIWRWEHGKSVPCGPAAARWADLLDELRSMTIGGPDAAA